MPAARAPMPAPAQIETPSMRRSAALAQALQDLRKAPAQIGGYGDLGARLLAQGITQWGANRAEKAVGREREATREAFLAGLPVAPEPAASGPALAAALVAPVVNNTQEPQQADIAPVAPIMGSALPDAAPAGVAAPPVPMADVPPMPQMVPAPAVAPAPTPRAPQASTEPQMPPQLAAYIRQLAQTDLPGAQAAYGNWQQQQAMMSQLPETIRNDPMMAWLAATNPDEFTKAVSQQYSPQVIAEGGSQRVAGTGNVYRNPRTFVAGGDIMQTGEGGVMDVGDVSPTYSDITTRTSAEQERRLGLLRLELDRDKYANDAEYRAALLDLDRRRQAASENAPRPGDNEDRAAIAGFEAANQRFAGLLRNIAGDPNAGLDPAFDLSPANAARYKLALATGIGMTPEAAAYGDYVSEIRAAVSDSLRLNTGPQTDQDAIREAEALLSNIDNREYVMRRLPTVMANNDRLRAGRQRLIQERRPAGGASAPSSTGNVARIQNDDDYNRLPSGQDYAGPDNVVRRKP